MYSSSKAHQAHVEERVRKKEVEATAKAEAGAEVAAGVGAVVDETMADSGKEAAGAHES
jgi:predicted metal-dependent phosphotriesterase family hydrolase